MRNSEEAWTVRKSNCISLDKFMQSNSIIECNKLHNQLLHSENHIDEGNHAVNVSATTSNQSNEITIFLRIVPVSIQSGGNMLNKYAFLDSGSTVSIIDQIVQEKLRAQGTDITLNISGKHGTKDLETEKVPLELKRLLSSCSQSTRLHNH